MNKTSVVQNMFSVLIASSNDAFCSTIKDVFSPIKFSPIICADCISKARNRFSTREYDIVLINSPLSDDSGVRFAIDVASRSDTVVLLVVKHEFYDSIFEKVAPYGIFVLSKPTSPQALMQVRDWLVSVVSRSKKSKKVETSLDDKMAEIRAVNRAKWILIDSLKMSESDAHHYIEKQSMNKGISKRQVAESIIQTYS